MKLARHLILTGVVGGAIASCYLGCGTGDPAAPGLTSPPLDATIPPFDAGNDASSNPGENVEALYPTLDALYQGESGIYRTCGPNNGVCHNSKQFPSLATLDSIVEDIDLPCNQLRDKPREMHDLCERPGDLLQIGGTQLHEIAYIENIDPQFGDDDSKARLWRIVLRDAPIADVGTLRVAVVRPPGLELVALSDNGATLSIDRDNAKAVKIQLPPPPDGGFLNDPGSVRAGFLANAGMPADPTAIQVGDPNRNGIFGAELGGRVIKSGDPTKSYLFTRLTDSKAGPLMPLANCCHWSRAAARALWCWVASLGPGGSHALDPIDYAKCPPGPPDSVLYPGQGPNCQTSGLCPMRAKGVLTDDPTWANIYPNIIQGTCTSCHSGGTEAAGGLDLGTSDGAWDALTSKHVVVPHDSANSLLYRKIDPATCGPLSCMPKPYSGAAFQSLEERARSIIKKWIDDGAAK